MRLRKKLRVRFDLTRNRASQPNKRGVFVLGLEDELWFPSTFCRKPDIPSPA
jgi:hypothetical protein